MIKLVACDLDGTLFLPGGVMPEETFAIIEKLRKKGVIFVPASGRQLPNLKIKFAPVLNGVAIIAENGGLAYYENKIIFSDPTPAKDVIYALGKICGVAGVHPLLSCTDCAYYSDTFPPFIESVKKSYTISEYAEDLTEIANGNITLKISVWDEVIPCAGHGGKLLPPIIKGLRTMVSGRDWLDVSVAHANKGRALRALQERLGIAPDECMGFGDHMNDLELLQGCGEAYVTANAFTGLKEYIKNEVPSNSEQGVITKLKELL